MLPPYQILTRVHLPFKRFRWNIIPIRSEADEKGMRRNMETLLRKCRQEDLRRIHKVVRALVEP
jgi:hypothetical protein